MAYNKVIYNNSTLIDLTSDTVTADTLAEGVTAHDKSGAVITGTMKVPTVITVSNLAISNWELLAEPLGDYSYRATITIDGVTEDMVPVISLDLDTAVSGNYCPVADTYDGGVYLYAKVNTSITISSIMCVKQ